jgi:hypothetical protein
MELAQHVGAHRTPWMTQGTNRVAHLFDCLHDMGEHLAPGGTVMPVGPFALGDTTDNIVDNPGAVVAYMASVAVCTPNSLSQ